MSESLRLMDFKKTLSEAKKQIESIIYRELDYENEIDTGNFGNKLDAILVLYEDGGFLALIEVLYDPVYAKVLEIILKEIGHIDNRDTETQRIFILLGFLQGGNVIVRDAALLGLASIDNISTLPALNAARLVETNIEFQTDIQQVINQLLETEQEILDYRNKESQKQSKIME